MNELKESAGDNIHILFKTITADNGKEFVDLEEALKHVIQVYYCEPYCSWQRGTSENQHKLIRRFIPKVTRIDSFSHSQIKRIQRWMNNYPRKQFDFKTSYDLFVREFACERNAA